MTPPTPDNQDDRVENQIKCATGAVDPHAYPKALTDAVDALDVLLTATAPHIILQHLGDEWGKGIQALAAARALIGPRTDKGTA